MGHSIQGIAESLQREQPNRTISDLWTDAMAIYRVQFERVVLPPQDQESDLLLGGEEA